VFCAVLDIFDASAALGGKGKASEMNIAKCTGI
jgi:hypothetical protein